MRRASRQAWCEAPRPRFYPLNQGVGGWGVAPLGPQHADLAHTSAARRGQGHAQKNQKFIAYHLPVQLKNRLHKSTKLKFYIHIYYIAI
ncbi:MAG: hypothetical protein RML94_08485 [Bacteroidia bacterium]|nr:hypothetical protein [Bacteroidia bacterium]